MKKYSLELSNGLDKLDVEELDRDFWKKIKQEQVIAKQWRSRNTEEQKRGIKDGKAKF
jgi:hypothetical protein